jgi:DNA-binding IclR family transcriptional regulator
MRADMESVLEPRDGRLSQSLVYGLALLECFTGERPSRGIADLSDELGMGRSTTHRYATTLVALGFLERDYKRRYRLGLGGADVAFSLLYSLRLRELALPHLQRLRECSRCTVFLSVRHGEEVLCIMRLLSHRVGWRASNEALHVGSRSAARATPLGRVLLGAQPAGLIEDGEGEPAGDVRSLAAPILDGQGQALAAIGLLAPSLAHCVGDLSLQFGAELLSTAAGIAAGLGEDALNVRTH